MHRVYRFSEYCLDPTRHEFWVDNELVPLQLKVFEVLAYLIENRDRAVGRDELISAVWGRLDVSDNILSQIIGRARQAVGDSGNEQRAIRTVPRFGYCWVLPIEELETELTTNGDYPYPAGAPPTVGVEFIEAQARAARAGNAGQSGELQSAEPQPQHAPAPGSTPPDAPPARTNCHLHATGDASRINGPPASLQNEAERESSQGGSPPSGRAPGPRRWLAVSLAVSALATASVVGAVFWPRASEESPSPAALGQTALVMPVEVVGAANADWVRLGVMDLIAKQLRTAGQAVIPSDNTVALMQNIDGPPPLSPEAVADLAERAAANVVLRVTAEPIDDHWQVSIRTVTGTDRDLTAYGDGRRVISAALGAVDRMAILLGLPVLEDDAFQAGVTPVERVLHQVRAAILSDRLDEAMALLEDLDEKHQTDSRVRYQKGNIHLRAGRKEQAQAVFESILNNPATKYGSPEYARAQFGLAESLNGQLDYEAAEQEYAQAIELLEELDGYEAQNLVGKAFMGLAGARGFQGKHDPARSDLARARIALESTGDRLALARLDGNLAILMTHMARYSEAIPSARRSAELLADFGDVQNEARARLIMAVSYGALLESQSALKELSRIDELLARVESPALVEAVNHYRIGILLDNGKLDAAHALLEDRMHQAKSGEEEFGRRLAWPQAIQARIALETGDADRAARLAETALERPWDPAMGGAYMRVWLTRLRAQIDQERLDGASETLQDAKAWAQNHSKQLVEIYLGLMKAELAAAQGNLDQARGEFDSSLELAMERGIPIEIFQVSKPYGTHMIETDDLERASVIAGHVAGWAEQYYDAALLQVRLYRALGNRTAWRRSLERAQDLAGEREIPHELSFMPVPGNSLAAGNSHAGS